MKINLAKPNGGYTRPQLLLLVLLCVVAFEVGVRYAQKHAESKPPTVITRTITTNAVTTQIVTQAQPMIPKVDEETETNLPPETNGLLLARRPSKPATNSVAKSPPPPGPGGPGSKMMKGEVGSPYKRRSVSTNSVTVIGSEPAPGNPYGIRVQLP